MKATAALLRALPLLAPLPAPVVEQLAGRAVGVRVAAGHTVVVQGEPGDRFYAIAELLALDSDDFIPAMTQAANSKL